MSFTVKVQVGEHLFRLPPQTHTIRQVRGELAERFPSNATPFVFYYQGRMITNLEEIITEARLIGKASLKIEARP